MGLFAGTKWDLPAHCDRCGCLESDCHCPPGVPGNMVGAKLPAEQTLKIRVEKRKAGRVVTIISGLDAADATRNQILANLKNGCGAGGSLEAANLLIQGDQLARATQLLEQSGYRISR